MPMHRFTRITPHSRKRNISDRLHGRQPACCRRTNFSAASGGGAAGVAFETGAVAQQSEIAAFLACLAFIALRLGLGTPLCSRRACERTLLAARERNLLDLVRRREFLRRLRFECCAAGDFGSRLARGETGGFFGGRQRGRRNRDRLPPL